ncbi:MAG: hypothetical protein IJC71_01320 [Clostridia bacterium]|nr:hypothetical protein [Clostridia bacterium]
MKLTDMTFHRRFSLNLYKNKKLKLGEMSFTKDFAHTTRGDLYPVLAHSGDYEETIAGNRYAFTSDDGKITRLLGQFFPYATYEMTLGQLNGSAGFAFRLPGERNVSLILTTENGAPEAVFSCGERTERAAVDTDFRPGCRLVVTVRGHALDLYYDNTDCLAYKCSFGAEEIADSVYRKVFMASCAAVEITGKAVLSDVQFYLDCGISQADIRPIRYENGDVMIEAGKIYLTISIRMEAECYQGVFSWVPGTAELELTGALFYDAGDDRWGNDVAASILYHRGEGLWYIWVCSFCRGHILGYAKAAGDVRFGVNALDITLMDPLPEGADETLFLGKKGDEDPDFYYDAEEKKWHMSVCRVSDRDRAYRYFFFESDEPFSGYRCIGHTKSGAETGGSFVKADGERYFVCGNDFSKRADYRIYRPDDFDTFAPIRCDYDDGGFRGWGTIIPCPVGTRMKYYWLTFDRHNGSGYNWSYGNLYCCEADSYELLR